MPRQDLIFCISGDSNGYFPPEFAYDPSWQRKTGFRPAVIEKIEVTTDTGTIQEPSQKKPRKTNQPK